MSILITAGLAVWLGGIVVQDIRSLRIPDALSLPLVAAGLVVAWGAGLVPGTRIGDHVIGAAVAYGLFALIGGVYFRARGAEGLGLGDAKLFAAAGAWLGWASLPGVLLIAALGGLAQAMARRADDRGLPLAFGPWLAAGMFAMWLYRVFW